MCHRERRTGPALAHNENERRNDPTAHAEMVAIRDLCGKLGVAELKGRTLYCTLQPCGMCSLACVWAGISRILKSGQIALCPFNTCSSHLEGGAPQSWALRQLPHWRPILSCPIEFGPISAWLFFFFGTLAPFFRASDNPIAMACFLLFTRPPFPALPDRNIPFFLRCVALFTDLRAVLLDLAIVFLHSLA